MSFGFGPGDIVALINFSKKVYDALENEEGSQVQYRRAAKQCDAFTAVINQVKMMDLSHFPTDFRQELEGIYTNAAEHITSFRKDTIDKYEKSLGNATKRGVFASAPRKVQWAFGAAQDMDGLRQSLSAWLSAIQVCIMANLPRMFEHSLRNQGPFPAYPALPAPLVRSLTLPQLRQEAALSRQPLYLGWAPPATQHLEMERTANLISDLVYKRLLSRPGLSIAETPKVFTLGPGDDAEAAFLRGSNRNEKTNLDPPQSHLNNHVERTRSASPPSEYKATTEAPGSNIVDDTNSYLQDMHLPSLTASEAASLLGRDHNPQISTSDQAQTDPTQDHSDSHEADSSRRTHVETDTRPRPFLQAASNILAFPALAVEVAKTAYQLRVATRDEVRPQYEVVQLYRKLEDYTELLRSIEATLSRSSLIFFKHDQARFPYALESSVDVISSITEEVQRIVTARRFFGRALAGRFVWMARRRRIMAMMSNVDALKVNLLIMLQVSQMENDREMSQRVEFSYGNSLALLERRFATNNSRVDV